MYPNNYQRALAKHHTRKHRLTTVLRATLTNDSVQFYILTCAVGLIIGLSIAHRLEQF